MFELSAWWASHMLLAYTLFSAHKQQVLNLSLLRRAFSRFLLIFQVVLGIDRSKAEALSIRIEQSPPPILLDQAVANKSSSQQP